MKSRVLASTMILLVIVLSSFSFIGVTASGTEYDPISDLDRDGDVDIFDIVSIVDAYGSVQSLPIQPNTTTILVYRVESRPCEVENALVAIIDPDSWYRTVQVGTTDSFGEVK